MTGVVQFTDAGLAELVSAKNQGIQGRINKIAAGSRSYTPLPNQQALLQKEQEVEILDFEELSPTQLRMGTVFAGTKEYEVREIGFYLESGTLLAVYSIPNEMLTYKSANSSWVQKFTLDISPLPSGSVTVVVGTENINLMMTEELGKLALAQCNANFRYVKQRLMLASAGIR